jgi:hypothetical protein
MYTAVCKRSLQYLSSIDFVSLPWFSSNEVGSLPPFPLLLTLGKRDSTVGLAMDCGCTTEKSEFYIRQIQSDPIYLWNS